MMPMTVSKLRKALENLDDDSLILLAHDPEGNSFSPLFQAERVTAQDAREITEMAKAPEVFDNTRNMLILWPFN